MYHIQIKWLSQTLYIVQCQTSRYLVKTRFIEKKTGAFVYQPFPYIYIHRLISNCAESENSFLCRYSYVTKKLSSGQTPRRTSGVWLSQFFLYLRKPGLPRWCHKPRGDKAKRVSIIGITLNRQKIRYFHYQLSKKTITQTQWTLIK